MRAKGITGAEIDLPWGGIEPSNGTYDFSELDTELANAAKAHITLVPIFWQSGWSGSPASWETDREVTSDGATGVAPAWWGGGQAAYLSYVEKTVRHITHEPGYGGSILDYGFLDAQWDNQGTGGWAATDVDEFHAHYLPDHFHGIAAFNAKYGTTYASFSEVPAAKPGEPLADVYQAFRSWSVEDTYGRMTAAVRKVTDGPLYYYFGGHLANAPSYANNPDTFFSLASRYDVTVIVDAAQSPGLALTFGSLARAYGVKLAQEWTAPDGAAALNAQAAQWVANYGLGLPEGGGEDFFIHDGTDKDVYGYPIYTSWLSTLKSLDGSYPSQPVALYIDVSQGYDNSAGGSLVNVENLITTAWDRDQSGFDIVTSQEIANGRADLSHYRAVLPLNGQDARIAAYASHGGVVLNDDSQLTDYAPAYAQLTSAGALQVVPTVAADGRSAQIVVAEVSSVYPYDGSVVLRTDGLNLKKGAYHVVDGTTGRPLAQSVTNDGGLCVPTKLDSAGLAYWRVVAGPIPRGTPAPLTCPVTSGSAESTVSVTAGAPGEGMQFLGLGQTGHGADGNLTETTQGGTAAVETWTSSQSGAPTSNVYLQVDPSSAVAAAADIDLTVTYWGSAGQGFTAQYDAPGDPYHAAPSVSSAGSGTWETQTVRLSGSQLSEAQNLSADLRLVAKDATQPLIVASVSMSVAKE
ncbi:beta-galactosidase [Planctomonas sp. JC2975]|uniref:beta-galactosidase n=1 Tax=Planctomonas sp. JC2975 TaxID=2729626 RepID=UPI00197BE326|nr:beta-galactosidase [Planctomonas sp. JC2975]